MSPPTLRITPIQNALPSILPHLLPVHIPWDGIAPISTYFRVKPASPDSAAKSQTDIAADASDTANGTTQVSESENAGRDSKSSPFIIKSLAKRFVSAFRGRTIQGLETPLPKGYTGVVLRTADIEEHERIERDARRRRDMSSSTEDEMIEEDGEVKYLVPASTFSSFVVWHPDIPVDKGQDEYLQSISEWMAIAAEIHKVPTQA